MSKANIRIWTPEIATELDEDDLAALLDELEKMAASSAPRPNITDLIDALNHAGNHDSVFEPTDEQRALLLRATDHLRNLGQTGDVLTLRDRLIGAGDVQGITYETFVHEQPPGRFTGYSLRYAAGERLVDHLGLAYSVAAITDDNGIALEPWPN